MTSEEPAAVGDNSDGSPLAQPSAPHPPAERDRAANASTRKPIPPEKKAARLDALIKAIDWAHVVGWQITRLHEAEEAALRADSARRAGSDYRPEHRQPFSRLRAEVYFVLGATRQLIRATERSGDPRGMPSFAHGSKVLVAVRNAVEHWDGRAPKELAKHTSVAWDDYTFGAGGTVIAGVVKVNELQAWAEDVQEPLLQRERDWR